MIEIKTLKQNLEGDVSREDIEVAEAINEGWQILNIVVLDRNDDYSMLRVITLKRETPAPVQAPSLPQDVIDLFRKQHAVALGNDAKKLRQMDEAMYALLRQKIIGEGDMFAAMGDDNE